MSSDERRAAVPLTFLFVGGVSLAIDVGVLTALRELGGLPVPVSTAAGLLASFTWNYLGQQRLTFRSPVPARRGIPRYVALVVANAVTTLILVQVAVLSRMGYLTGKAVAIVVLTFINFYAYRAWVFPNSPVGREELNA